jgi:hypothetical protein
MIRCNFHKKNKQTFIATGVINEPITAIIEVRVAQSTVFCAMFCRSLFVLFLLTIVLSVLLQFTIILLVKGFLLTSKLTVNYSISVQSVLVDIRRDCTEIL